MNNNGFTIKDLLIRLILIIVFIFLLIWLFPMPNLKPLNNQIFADNLDRMKNVAKTYYTTERLPEHINDYRKMSLKQMIDNKLILPLMDSNGNYCSTDKSYVQVTKLENEYIIKVYLSCTDKQDYIIEHFGCYDICSDKCKALETTTTTTHKYEPTTYFYRTTGVPRRTTTARPLITTSKNNYVYEYQYMKNSCSNIFDKYSCDSGYTVTGDKCIKNGSKVVTEAAKKKTTDVTSTDTKKAEVVVTSKDEKINATKSTKTVTTTEDAKSSDTTVAKTLKSVQTITANKTTTYDVKAAIGTEKTIYADYSIVQNYDIITAAKYASAYKWTYVSTRTSYNGGEAFANDNEKLVLVDSWQELTCETCFTTVTIYKYYRYKKEYTDFTYSCDPFPGYTLYDGNKCKKATTQTKSCPSGYQNTGSSCKKVEVSYSCASYGSSYVYDSSKKTCTKTNVSYSCPSGSTPTSDSKYCTKNVYGCPTGTTENSSGTCTKKVYSCPSNTSTKTYTLSGTKCTVKENKTVYSCPTGTNPTTDEKYCVKTTSSSKYSCDKYSGYTLKDSYCVKTTTTQKVTYECADKDAILTGQTCTKTVSTKDTKDAKKEYKQSCNQEYKWSTNPSLDGWIYTGNKRLLTY